MLLHLAGAFLKVPKLEMRIASCDEIPLVAVEGKSIHQATQTI
jgi:hypothetical protein